MEISKANLGDTLDVIPIGSNKHSVLLAVYDRENELFQTLCKLPWSKSKVPCLKRHLIPEPLYNYDVAHTDIEEWYSPDLVFEVTGS